MARHCRLSTLTFLYTEVQDTKKSWRCPKSLATNFFTAMTYKHEITFIKTSSPISLNYRKLLGLKLLFQWSCGYLRHLHSAKTSYVKYVTTRYSYPSYTATEQKEGEIARSNLIMTKLVTIYNLELQFIRAKRSYKDHSGHNQTTLHLFPSVFRASKSCLFFNSGTDKQHRLAGPMRLPGSPSCCCPANETFINNSTA